MVELHRQMQKLIERDDLLEQRYHIGEGIGAGAYGMIFRAVDEQTGDAVAVKAIPPQARQRSSTAIGRFQREMKVIRNLNHPNIISLHDWGRTDEGLIFMVLEFIDGETLDSVVRDRPMDPQVAIDTTCQLASALHAAHEEGVIHRDLKPANVMLTPRRGGYSVKVLDFGMAKVLSPLDDESSIVDLTSEGMAVGTPRYIAPEQARGLQVGPATDLYAVGLLMYEMFTGVQAVDADTVKEAVTAHVSPAPLELRALERVPEVIQPVLLGLVEKDGSRRIQSGRQLVRLLKDAQRAAADESAQSDPSPARVDPGEFHPSSASSEIEPDSMDVELELETEPVADDRPTGEDREGPDRAEHKTDHHRLRRDRWFRPPRTAGEWVEGTISVALIPLTFLAIGAQASSWDLGARVLIAFAPPLMALGLALIRDSAAWEESFGRLCWMCCVTGLVIAHVVGPRQLAMALVLDPVWFLEPVEGAPGVGVLERAVRWVSYQWAEILFGFGTDQGR